MKNNNFPTRKGDKFVTLGEPQLRTVKCFLSFRKNEHDTYEGARADGGMWLIQNEEYNGFTTIEDTVLVELPAVNIIHIHNHIENGTERSS